MEKEDLELRSRSIQFNNKPIIFRAYGLENDNIKLVRNLFTKMNSEKGLEELHKGDKSFESPKNYRLVAECEDEFLATITLKQDAEFTKNSIVNMYAVVTREDYQGSGISSIFFDFACSWAKEMRGTKIKLSVKKNNPRAIRFYEKMNCLQVGALENEFVYEKEL